MKPEQHWRGVQLITLIIQLALVLIFQRALAPSVPTYLTFSGKVVAATTFKSRALVLADVGYLVVLTLLVLALVHIAGVMRARAAVTAPVVANLLIVFAGWLYLFSWALLGYCLGATRIAAGLLTMVNSLAVVAGLLTVFRWWHTTMHTH